MRTRSDIGHHLVPGILLALLGAPTPALAATPLDHGAGKRAPARDSAVSKNTLEAKERAARASDLRQRESAAKRERDAAAEALDAATERMHRADDAPPNLGGHVERTRAVLDFVEADDRLKSADAVLEKAVRARQAGEKECAKPAEKRAPTGGGHGNGRSKAGACERGGDRGADNLRDGPARDMAGEPAQDTDRLVA